MMFSTADSVYLDTDEGRFQLHIHTDEGEHIIADIHAQAIEFYENVQAELGGWAREALEARHAVRSGVTREEYLDSGYRDELGSGYALDDPKHPTYHERMVDA